MSIKLSTSRSLDAAGKSLMDSALEISLARENLLQCGQALNELVQVCDNISFIKDAIESNGVQWYIDNCDPENNFAHTFNVLGKKKEVWTAKADAAMEGIIGDIWDKIKEWWERFWNWLKSIFSGDKSKKIAENIEEASKTAEENKKADSDTKKKRKDKLKETTTRISPFQKALSLWKRIKEKFSKGSEEALVSTGNTVAYMPGMELPDINGINLLVTKIMPSLAAPFTESTSSLENFFNSVEKYINGSLTDEELTAEKESFDKRTSELIEKYSSMIGKYDDEMMHTLVKPSNGKTYTLADLKITDEDTAHRYVDGVKAVKPIVKRVEDLLTKLTNLTKKMSNTIKSSKQGNPHPAIRYLMSRAASTTKDGLTFIDMGEYLSEVAICIEDAIAKAA